MDKSSLRKSENPALVISVVYLIVSALWIVVTDWLIRFDNTGTIQTEKGLFFIIVTTVLLYFLTDRYARAARVNQRRLEALTLRDTMGVIYADANGRIFDANDLYLKIVGFGRTEIEAGLLNWRSLTPPEFAAEEEAAWEQLRSEGSCKTYRKEICRRDGTRIPLLVGGTVSCREPFEVVGFLLDITERELVRSEVVRLARIVENAHEAIVSYSLDGIITTWNRGAEMQYGYRADEAIGKSGHLIAPHGQPDEWDRVVRAVQSGVSGTFEVLRKRKSGETIPVSVSVSPTLDSSGKVIGASSIGIDISDLKRAQLMEAQFQQAQKLESLGRLAGGVAHDFNNLLMVITSFTQLLKEEPSASPLQQQYADEILTAADRAAALTRQLLTFSRKQSMKLEPLDVNRVITETARMLERVIGEDVKLRLLLGDSLWHVEADTAQLTQVMMNLCVNARDAMPNGGVLTLATGNVTVSSKNAILGINAGQWVYLRVSDSGTGMNAVTKSKIFEPFFTTKEQGRGTGLGLSLVYGVVKQLGGHIRVESALGEGTTFTIYLPRTTRVAQVKTAEEPAALSGHETVLVVEDEHSLRSSISSFLERRGYRVFSASSGTEALHLMRSQKPRLDLLITDLGMPDMTGLELWERLRHDKADRPTIFITGYADGWKNLDRMAHVVVLAKPFALDELGRAVRELLDRAKTPPSEFGRLFGAGD